MSCLAKKPGGRPKNALELAEKAEALMTNAPRRSNATRVMTTANPQVSQATTVIETQDEVDAKPPIIWPWIAMIVLMVIVAGTIIVAMVRGPEPTTSPTPSQSATPSESASPTPTPTETPTDPNTVIVLSSDIFGMNLDAATAYLEGLGLSVLASEGLVVPADDARIMTVYDATPLGTLAKGDTITILFYIADQPVADGTGN